MDHTLEKATHEIVLKDREMIVLRTELSDATNEIVDLKLERERKAQKYNESEEKIAKEKELRMQQEATCKELTISLNAIRSENEALSKETHEAVAACKSATDENTKLKVTMAEMRDRFESERSELSSVLKVFRQERKKEFSVLEAELRAEMEMMEEEADELRHALEESEEDVKEEAARAAELELALYEAQAELDESRDRIIDIARASAKIGHFSMRTGGGWEKVGDAWSKCHAWVSSTKWGREAGLTQDYFAAKELNTPRGSQQHGIEPWRGERSDTVHLSIPSVGGRTPRTPRAAPPGSAMTTPRTPRAPAAAAATPRTAATSRGGGVPPAVAVASPRHTPRTPRTDHRGGGKGMRASSARPGSAIKEKETPSLSFSVSTGSRGAPEEWERRGSRSPTGRGFAHTHVGDSDGGVSGVSGMARLRSSLTERVSRSRSTLLSRGQARGYHLRSASARLAARASYLSLESPPSPSISQRSTSPISPKAHGSHLPSPDRVESVREVSKERGKSFELLDEGMDCTQLVAEVGILWEELAGGGIDQQVVETMLDRLSERLRATGEAGGAAKRILAKLKADEQEVLSPFLKRPLLIRHGCDPISLAAPSCSGSALALLLHGNPFLLSIDQLHNT